MESGSKREHFLSLPFSMPCSGKSESSKRRGKTLQLHTPELLSIHTGRAKEDRYHILARLSPGQALRRKLCLLSP